MARTRLIHPGAALDEDVMSLSLEAAYLWAFLPCHADRAGRLHDKPLTLRYAIIPTRNADVNLLLSELASKQFIVRYEVDGKRYIEIRNFTRYQRPHSKEAESSIPPYSTAGSVLAPTRDVASTSYPDPVSDTDPELEIDPDTRNHETRPSRDLFDQLLSDFSDQWEAHYGQPYAPTAKDRSQFGRLLAGMKRDGLSPSDLPIMWANYFADLSPFVAVEQRHSLAWFCTSGGVNKYRTQRPMLSAKEASGEMAGNQWLELSRGRT